MREKKVEEHLINRVERAGGLCWKFTSPGTSGVPDRICLLPGGLVFFVECKAPGKTPRPLQLVCRRMIEARDCNWACVSSIEEVDWLIDDLTRGQDGQS